MPKESRKRSRSKSPSSKKSRDRRSPGHERDRDRRDRDRDRQRDRRRSRSRERDRRRREERKRRSKSDSKSPTPTPTTSSSTKSKSRGNSQGPTAPKLNIEGALKFKDGPLDNEAEQKRLETEMQKRRERIERWRAEKKARDMGLLPGGPTASTSNSGEKKESTPVPKSAKKWNLSDDDEEDDDDAAATGGEPPSKLKKDAGVKNGVSEAVKKEESEDEIDPLDAYMMGIQKEVRSIGAKAKPTIIKGGVKKGAETNGASTETAASALPVAIKMEVDSPEVKKDTNGDGSADAATGAETNGDVKPAKFKKVVTIISGVAAKKTDIKKKGTLMEQNQDALEYSSEEEDASKCVFADGLLRIVNL